MKQTVVFLLALMLCLSLAGCAPAGTSSDSLEETESSPSDVVREHPLLDIALGQWQCLDINGKGELPYTSLLIRPDGTCRVDDVEAQWRIVPEMCGEDNVVFMFYTDAGDLYGAAVGTYLNALDPNGGMYPFSLNRLYDGSGAPTPIMSTILSLHGQWRESADAEPLLTINSDGTCILEGEACTWKIGNMINDQRFYFLIQSNGETLRELDYDSGNGYLIVGDTFLYNFVQYQQVALTAENFWDYFEIVERFQVNTNEFDDPTSMSYIWYICIREEYEDALYLPASSCVVELTYPIDKGALTPDWEAQTASLTRDSYLDEKTQILTFNTTHHNLYNLTCFYATYEAVWKHSFETSNKAEIPATDPAEITISRIKGELYFH